MGKRTGSLAPKISEKILQHNTLLLLLPAYLHREKCVVCLAIISFYNSGWLVIVLPAKKRDLQLQEIDDPSSDFFTSTWRDGAENPPEARNRPLVPRNGARKYTVFGQARPLCYSKERRVATKRNSTIKRLSYSMHQALDAG